MTKIKQLSYLFLIVLMPPTSWAQQTVSSTPLTTLFNKIEDTYNCTFAYKDQELEDHITDFKPTGDLTNVLDNLSKVTLFNYTLLPDKTVTVALKEDVKSRCILVMGAETGLTIQKATVSSQYQIKNTDDQGRVQIYTRRIGTEVAISSKGYNIRFYQVPAQNNTSCFTALLNLKTTQLPPITVTNYVAKGITKTTDGGINIDYDVFDILPGLIESDVLLTLQALPGIQSANETVSFLNIRGGTNDQNLILWDGIKMYQNGHFFGLISAFNPNLTKTVNVYKNGSSARYGDGVSGVIQMQGSQNLTDSIYGNAGLNMLSADAFVKIPLGAKAAVELAARRSTNELWETPTYSAYFNKAFQNSELQASSGQAPNSNEELFFFDTSLRFLYKPTPKDEFRLNLLVLGNELNFLENALVDNQTESRASNLSQDNLAGGIYYQHIWNNNTKSSVQLYGTNYRLMATNSDIINNQRLLQQNDILESGLKAQTQFTLNPQTSLVTGYQLNETGITNFESINNPTFEREEKQVLLTNSGFAELAYSSKNGSNRLITGLRINHISKFNKVLFEPRLEFRQRLSKAFTLELAAEIKSQTTTQVVDLQNDFLGVENRRWILAKPGEIPILKGRQLGLGLSYQQNRLLVSLEPYYKQVQGISSQSQGFQNQCENTRVHGDYKVFGLDFLANKQWNNTNIWLSYSFAKNNYEFLELSPQKFPNNIDIRHTITLGSTHTFGDFKVAAGINWHRGVPTTGILNQPVSSSAIIAYNTPNSINIPDYFRADFSATYSMNWSSKIKAIAGVSLWNLTDRKTPVNQFYRLNDSEMVEQITDQALRFTPNFSFKVLF